MAVVMTRYGEPRAVRGVPVALSVRGALTGVSVKLGWLSTGFPVDRAADGLMEVAPAWPGEPVRREHRGQGGVRHGRGPASLPRLATPAHLWTRGSHLH